MLLMFVFFVNIPTSTRVSCRGHSHRLATGVALTAAMEQPTNRDLEERHYHLRTL